MSQYIYYDKDTEPNLETLGSDIRGSSITAVYDGARWDVGCGETGKPPCEPGVCIQPCTGRIRVYFLTDLSGADKTTLDGIIANY